MYYKKFMNQINSGIGKVQRKICKTKTISNSDSEHLN